MEQYQLGKEVGISELDENDYQVLKENVAEFSSYFNIPPAAIFERQFIKLFPRWLRPYGRLYAY